MGGVLGLDEGPFSPNAFYNSMTSCANGALGAVASAQSSARAAGGTRAALASQQEWW